MSETTTLLEQAAELIEAMMEYRRLSGGAEMGTLNARESAFNRLAAAIDASPPEALVAVLRAAAGGG
jgi:hypothetical protein